MFSYICWLFRFLLLRNVPLGLSHLFIGLFGLVIKCLGFSIYSVFLCPIWGAGDNDVPFPRLSPHTVAGFHCCAEGFNLILSHLLIPGFDPCTLVTWLRKLVPVSVQRRVGSIFDSSPCRVSSLILQFLINFELTFVG